jgi:hypothetical protein
MFKKHWSETMPIANGMAKRVHSGQNFIACIPLQLKSLELMDFQHDKRGKKRREKQTGQKRKSYECWSACFLQYILLAIPGRY